MIIELQPTSNHLVLLWLAPGLKDSLQLGQYFGSFQGSQLLEEVLLAADKVPRGLTEVNFAWTSPGSWKQPLYCMLRLSGKGIRSHMWIAAPRGHLNSFMERMKCLCVLHCTAKRLMGAKVASGHSAWPGCIIMHFGHFESDVAEDR